MRSTSTWATRAAFGGALVLIAGLTACSSSTSPVSNEEISGEVSLLTPIFEGTPGQQLLEDELLPMFYEKYPDVTVKVDYTTYGKLNEKLTTSLVSGLLPDVMLMGVGWVEGFADKGYLVNLSENGLTEEKLAESYNETIIEAGMWDGNVYAVPIMLDTRFGVANMEILNEAGYDAPPSSWSELVEMSQALTVRDANGTLQRAGFDMMSLDARQAFEVMLFSAGGDLFNSDSTEPAFGSRAGVSALGLMADLVNKYKVEDIGFSASDTAVNPLLNGRAAMGIAHNNLWTQGLEAAPDQLDKLEPFLITGAAPGMFFGGTLATVSSSSKNPAAAQALLEFLSSPEAALAANEQRGNVPALTELLDSDYVQSNRFVQFAMENLQYAKREGGPAKWLEVRGDFKPAVESALLGSQTPEQALAGLEQLVKDAIAR